MANMSQKTTFAFCIHFPRTNAPDAFRAGADSLISGVSLAVSSWRSSITWSSLPNLRWPSWPRTIIRWQSVLFDYITPNGPTRYAVLPKVSIVRHSYDNVTTLSRQCYDEAVRITARRSQPA